MTSKEIVLYFSLLPYLTLHLNTSLTHDSYFSRAHQCLELYKPFLCVTMNSYTCILLRCTPTYITAKEQMSELLCIVNIEWKRIACRFWSKQWKLFHAFKCKIMHAGNETSMAHYYREGNTGKYAT